MRADWAFFGLLGLLLTVFLGVPRRFPTSLPPLEGPPRPLADHRQVFHVPQRKRLERNPDLRAEIERLREYRAFRAHSFEKLVRVYSVGLLLRGMLAADLDKLCPAGDLGRIGHDALRLFKRRSGYLKWCPLSLIRLTNCGPRYGIGFGISASQLMIRSSCLASKTRSTTFSRDCNLQSMTPTLLVATSLLS